jgi:hypothetical protein
VPWNGSAAVLGLLLLGMVALNVAARVPLHPRHVFVGADELLVFAMI